MCPSSHNIPFSFNCNRMAKTGDWTIPKLISYLVSLQLQPTEIERLRENPAFPKEPTTEQDIDEDGTLNKIPKFKVSDLYEPLDVFRNLGLPIINWHGRSNRHEWESNSKEGMSNEV